MLPIAVLMQAFHGLERLAQVAQVLFHHHCADAEPGGGMADKASDLGTVAIEKVSLVRRQFIQ